ncbi:MAG TPA: LPS export ABC transporter permease LptG [Xanthobacteraceae bacterium]|nr:LPS export ABC transporter permease LptG [Xanthobacteraceae bacterium]
MVPRVLGLYVARRFAGTTAAVFFGMFFLILLIDYIETTRRASHAGDFPAWFVAMTAFFRVPQIAERLLPFAVLVATMLVYLNLARRNELVIARAAGMSAWQFVMPAVLASLLFGLAATMLYNPLAALAGERAKRLEAQMFGAADATGGRFWLRQRSADGQSILYAGASANQGESLSGVSAFLFDHDGRFSERIEADSAKLEPGQWRLFNVRIYSPNARPRAADSYVLKTDLSPTQIRESLATPETVSFWGLPQYIDLAERAGLVAAGYRFQYQSLLARPFMLAAMVLLAASVSLRFFRFGGVQRMILCGMGAGFLLYVLSKVTEDLSKAALMPAIPAAWSPAAIGALAGVLVLLFQEDG